MHLLYSQVMKVITIGKLSFKAKYQDALVDCQINLLMVIEVQMLKNQSHTQNIH